MHPLVIPLSTPASPPLPPPSQGEVAALARALERERGAAQAARDTKDQALGALRAAEARYGAQIERLEAQVKQAQVSGWPLRGLWSLSLVGTSDVIATGHFSCCFASVQVVCRVEKGACGRGMCPCVWWDVEEGVGDEGLVASASAANGPPLFLVMPLSVRDALLTMPWA